jgi:hypothetical protein
MGTAFGESQSPIPTPQLIGTSRGLRRLVTNDHRPALVHIFSADGEAVLFLDCPDGPPELREVRTVDKRRLGR